MMFEDVVQARNHVTSALRRKFGARSVPNPIFTVIMDATGGLVKGEFKIRDRHLVEARFVFWDDKPYWKLQWVDKIGCGATLDEAYEDLLSGHAARYQNEKNMVFKDEEEMEKLRRLL